MTSGSLRVLNAGKGRPTRFAPLLLGGKPIPTQYLATSEADLAAINIAPIYANMDEMRQILGFAGAPVITIVL